MINLKDGKIKTKEGLSIDSNYTFDDFKSSKFYNGQDGIRIIYLEEKQTMNGNKFIISLFFREQKIYMVSLICCDFEFSDSDEPKRKLIHDEFLRKEGISIDVEYKWGKITSDYDSKSNLSSINITYI